MTWNSATVVAKIYEASDSIGRIDEQRLKQWVAALRLRPGEEVSSSLLGVFCRADRPRKRGIDQEYAGRLLLTLKPPCPPDIQDILRDALAVWEVSVEELPFYFEAVLGHDRSVEALDELSKEPCTEVELEAIRTFRFWLGQYKKSFIYGPNAQRK